MSGEPTPSDLVQELREACGLFGGSMSVTPKQAWEQAIERVKAMRDGKCSHCLDRDESPWNG